MLFSCNSFSQTIILSEKQAKSVASDLVKGKACAEELEATNAHVELLETKISLKDKRITNLESQKIVLLEKDTIRLNQIKAQDDIIRDTEKVLKKTERKSTLYRIIAVAGVITSGALLITR